MRNIKKLILIIFGIIIVVYLINIILNMGTVTTKYTLASDKILNDITVVQLTDIQSIRSQRQGSQVIEKVKNQNPDIILITGDLVDTNYYSKQDNLYRQGKITEVEENTIKFMNELKDISDVYYVYGNHEMILLDDPENNAFKKALLDIGINIINNKSSLIELGDTKINIVGVQDPSTLYKDEKYAYIDGNKEKVDACLRDLINNNSEFDKNNYTILLSHRPEFFDLYSKYNIDVAFTGHTHGGIVRFLNKGLYSRAEGLLPNYVYGEYRNDNFVMIVSSGIAYPEIPIRIFNPPEIVVTKLIRE